MEPGKALALNLRSLRKKSEISQAELATLSQVPRSTIANLESESGNPSLQNLVRIANALQINVDELLSPPRSHILLQKLSDITKVEKKGRAIVHKLLPDPIPGMEIDRVYIQPNSRMKGVPHSDGTKEYLVVIKGKVTVNISSASFIVNTDEVLSFPGDQPHSYFNHTPRECLLMSIVVRAPRYGDY